MQYGDYTTKNGAYDFKLIKSTAIGRWLCKHNIHKARPFTHWNQYHYYICIRCGMNCGPV